MAEGVVPIVTAAIFNVYDLSPFFRYSYSMDLEQSLEIQAHLTV